MAGKDSEAININEIAGLLARVIYQAQLKSLDDTLVRFHTPATRYSILDDRDDTYCIDYENGNWITYTSEHGNKSSVLHFENVDDACKKVMYYMSESSEEYDQMVYYYENLLAETGRESFSSKDIYTTLKVAVNQIK